MGGRVGAFGNGRRTKNFLVFCYNIKKVELRQTQFTRYITLFKVKIFSRIITGVTLL